MALAWPYALPVLQNRNLWAALSLITILLFTSGHMFNHIRKVPYVAGDGKGGINYFAGGFSNQFGLETQIVAAMCTLSILFLSSFAKRDTIRRIFNVTSPPHKSCSSLFVFSEAINLVERAVNMDTPFMITTIAPDTQLSYSATNSRHRWNALICNNRTCTQSPANDRHEGSATRSLPMGCCHVSYVQLFTECFPSQERRISILSTTILGSECCGQINIIQPCM